MWEFLTHFTDTEAGQITVFVLLAAVIVAVIQFVRGDWKIVRTKEGKTILTTAQQRTSYDTSKSVLKLVQQHIAADAEKFEGLRKDKAETDSRLAAFIERSDGNDERIMEDTRALKKDLEDSKADRGQIHAAVSALARDTHTLRLESIKTQILLRETSMERKLYLYDEYKKMGGNGWMDRYMRELQEGNGEGGAV